MPALLLVKTDRANVVRTIRAAHIVANAAQQIVPAGNYRDSEDGLSQMPVAVARQLVADGVDALERIAHLLETERDAEAWPLTTALNELIDDLSLWDEDRGYQPCAGAVVDAFLVVANQNDVPGVSCMLSSGIHPDAARAAICEALEAGVDVSAQLCELFEIDPSDWVTFATVLTDGYKLFDAVEAAKLLATGRG